MTLSVHHQLNLSVTESVAFLHVQGEIDLSNADSLRALGSDAISDIVRTIRIDLSGVTFMDSSGINALVRIRNKADGAGRVLIIDRPSPYALRVLQLAGLTDAFTIWAP